VPTERTESDYYAFREFDDANARKVLSFYTQFFPTGPVVELACGPGVFLGLLTEAGVGARGVDLDPGMVDRARAAGHDVVLANAISYLEGLPDASIEGLFAAHFLEHLPAGAVQTVYDQAARVLVPGGCFVSVVPNAACLSVLAYDFWRDPTHVRFYDPVALDFFARQAGLTVVRSGGNPENHPGPPPHLRAAPSSVDPGLSESVQELIQHATWLAGRPAPPSRRRFRRSAPPRVAPESEPTQTRVWGELGNVLGRLDARIQTLQNELRTVNTAHNDLLAQLYQENEVFVVARRWLAGES
jgi:SAM-dependent methyltransferase